MYLKLLNAATATNSPPSGATAGFDLGYGKNPGSPDQGMVFNGQTECILLIRSTAGSGTMTGTFKLWGYSVVAGAWFPLGVHATDASRGLVNDANAVGENQSDSIQHAEVVESLRHFQRVYLEITAIGGTATAFSAWIVANS